MPLRRCQTLSTTHASLSKTFVFNIIVVLSSVCCTQIDVSLTSKLFTVLVSQMIRTCFFSKVNSDATLSDALLPLDIDIHAAKFAM